MNREKKNYHKNAIYIREKVGEGERKKKKKRTSSSLESAI